MCNGNIFKDLVMSKLSGQWCYNILEQLEVYLNITGARLKFPETLFNVFCSSSIYTVRIVHKK